MDDGQSEACPLHATNISGNGDCLAGIRQGPKPTARLNGANRACGLDGKFPYFPSLRLTGPRNSIPACQIFPIEKWGKCGLILGETAERMHQRGEDYVENFRV